MALAVQQAASVCWVGAWSLLCCAAALVACTGEVVNLGSSRLEAGGAGSDTPGPSGVWGVQSQPVLTQEPDLLLANPTLTAAMDELYYSAQKRYATPEPNPTRIERAQGAGWRSHAQVTLGSLLEPDVSSPAISADGQELWLGMSLAGSTDIFRSARQGDGWATPELVPELSHDQYDDVPRPPAVNGTIMPLSSKRHGNPLYQIYLSTRPHAKAAWDEPSNVLLGTVDSADFQSADGFLSADGLELYFSSTRDGEHTDSDLYVVHRDSLDAKFGEPEALVDLNDPDPAAPSEERMPWLSPDKTRLYFVSDRTGQYTLHLASRL